MEKTKEERIKALDFQKISNSRDEISQIASLMKTCFPDSTIFSDEYIETLYFKNPDGNAQGWNAVHDGKVVAHYVTIPAAMLINGKSEQSLLSLNTATHPEWGGLGLFTKLAKMTYDSAKENGFSSVYGVANENSTHGFITKLGFQLVSPLHSWVGVGGSIPKSTDSKVASFQRIWTPESLEWRLSWNFKKYWNVLSSNEKIYAKTEYPLFKAAIFQHDQPTLSEKVSSKLNRRWAPLTVWLGMLPKRQTPPFPFFELPKKLRPSPLNLIFKDLTSAGRTLNKDEIFFQPIDFDAF